MAKKYKYSFTGKKEAREGRGVIVLSSLSLVLFIVSVIVSFQMGGNAGTFVGAFGLFSFLTAVYAFILGMKAMRNRKTATTTAIVGSVFAGCIMILWLAMFLLGVK